MGKDCQYCSLSGLMNANENIGTFLGGSGDFCFLAGSFKKILYKR